MAGLGETLVFCGECRKVTRIQGMSLEELSKQQEKGASFEDEEVFRCGFCGKVAERWGEEKLDERLNEIEDLANLNCPRCGNESVEKDWFGIWD